MKADAPIGSEDASTSTEEFQPKAVRTESHKVLILDDLAGNKMGVSEMDLRTRCEIRHAYGLTIHKFQVTILPLNIALMRRSEGIWRRGCYVLIIIFSGV